MSDQYLASQEMSDQNDHTPTDEDIRQIHYDGNLWSEPEDQGKNFDRWLTAHDEKVCADTLARIAAAIRTLSPTPLPEQEA